MINHRKTASLRPLTLAWVIRQLKGGERIVAIEALHGGITAEMRRLTIGARDGSIRHLVVRSVVDPTYVKRAEDALHREAGALALLAGTGVPAPRLVAVDSTGAHCKYPSLLMTQLAGRTVLDDDALETRVPLLARQLVTIHAVQPAERAQTYVALTTADSVVTLKNADAAIWAAAIKLIRRSAPAYEGRFLHRDFQPGNVLFDAALTRPEDARITGVVDWAAASWGPADLDVAHCSVNLALLHGPEWGLRFTEAYEEAGGLLATAARERLYWQVRDGLASSEEVQVLAQLWRDEGRAELTTRIVEKRFHAYMTVLMDTTPRHHRTSRREGGN